ncbi:MAG: hypothetical protein ACRDTC_25445 [Pseudonocardiaceae bacterium]
MSAAVDLLDAIRAHLVEFELPPPCSVRVCVYGPEVSAQLASRDAPELAVGLLAWVDTLTEPTARAWRVPSGDSVHLSITGQLPTGVPVHVYGGVPFTPHGLGSDLEPDGRAPVLLVSLRHLATLGEVTL